jgi:outer membrane protein TolC
MTWPGAPWSHGRTDARSAAATAGISVAKAQLVAAERTRGLAVQEAWVRANTAASRVSLIDTSVLPQAAQSLASARIAYESGRAEFAALLDAGRVLLDERLRRLRAQGEFLMARADLDLAVGSIGR